MMFSIIGGQHSFGQYQESNHTEPKKVFVRGLVNFVPAVAYLFCLNLPAAFSQPRSVDTQNRLVMTWP